MTRRRTNSPSNICTTGYIPRSLTMLPSLENSFPAARTAPDEAGTAFPALAAPMTPLPSPSLLQFRRRHVCGGTGPPALKRRKWCNPNADAVEVVTPSSSSSSSSSSPPPFSPAFSIFRPIPASKTSLPLLNIIDNDDDDDEDNDEALQDCTAQNNNGRNTGVLIQCPVPRISLRRRTRSNRYFSSVQEYYLNEFEEASPQPPSPCDHADVTNELGRLPISPSARQELSPARRRRIRVLDATSVPASPSSSSFSPSFPVLASPSYEDAIENDDASPLFETRKDHEDDSVASTTATTMPETLLLSSKDRTIASAPTLQATRSRTRSDDTSGRRYPSTTTAQIHKTMRRSISLNVSLSFLNLTAPASSSSLATCVDDSFDGDDDDVVDPSFLPVPLPSSSSHQSFGSSLLAPLMKRPSSLLQLSKSFSSSLSLDHLLASTPGTSSSTTQGGRGSSPTSWSEGGPDPPPKPRGRSSPFDYLATAMRFPDVAIGLSI